MNDETSDKSWNRRTWLGGALSLAGSALALAVFKSRSKGSREHKAKGDVMEVSTTQALQGVAQVLSPQEEHWVGDGFFVSTIFSPYQVDAQLISPFVLMDHAAPRSFRPTLRPRGVGEHPHRGFETVTFAYSGEIQHRDSAGGGGTISAGDVQWMTAASGVVHEEKHSQAFSDNGGIFEMVQLWVNLPAKLKMSPPQYQGIPMGRMGSFRLGDATGRLVAGTFAGAAGPAKTHSPITIFQLEFQEAGTAEFELAKGSTTLVFLLEGDAVGQGAKTLRARDLLLMDRQSTGKVRLDAKAGARVLVLNGEPLNEPVVARGPFVMNTDQEIAQAVRDYQSGKMGRLRSAT